jgi:hypothetical protein
MGVINAISRAAVEGFMGSPENPKSKDTYADALSMIIAVVLSVVILAFIGKLLWNGVVVDLFTFAKPARSFWQILGLMIFVSLINI